MKFVTLRDFRAHTADIRRDLDTLHEIVLTANGRPVAILAKVDEEDFEKTLNDLRRSRARSIVSRIRGKAAARGAGQLTMEEIGAVTTEVRRKKRARK